MKLIAILSLYQERLCPAPTPNN